MGGVYGQAASCNAMRLRPALGRVAGTVQPRRFFRPGRGDRRHALSAPATIQVQPPCRRRCASVHLTRHWAQRSCSSSRREAGGPAAPLSVLAACSLPQLSRTALRFTDSPLAASHILGRTTPIQLGLPTPQTRRQVARSSLSGPVVAARLPLDWPLKHQAVAQPGAFTLSVSSSRRLPAGLPRAISPVAAGPCRSSGTTARPDAPGTAAFRGRPSCRRWARIHWHPGGPWADDLTTGRRCV